jgi:hypothetical protein
MAESHDSSSVRRQHGARLGTSFVRQLYFKRDETGRPPFSMSLSISARRRSSSTVHMPREHNSTTIRQTQTARDESSPQRGASFRPIETSLDHDQYLSSHERAIAKTRVQLLKPDSISWNHEVSCCGALSSIRWNEHKRRGWRETQ